jgi:hypothetical protein
MRVKKIGTMRAEAIMIFKDLLNPERTLPCDLV